MAEKGSKQFTQHQNEEEADGLYHIIIVWICVGLDEVTCPEWFKQHDEEEKSDTIDEIVGKYDTRDMFHGTMIRHIT